MVSPGSELGFPLLEKQAFVVLHAAFSLLGKRKMK
jgi:hypothetical protein